MHSLITLPGSNLLPFKMVRSLGASESKRRHVCHGILLLVLLFDLGAVFYASQNFGFSLLFSGEKRGDIQQLREKLIRENEVISREAKETLSALKREKGVDVRAEFLRRNATGDLDFCFVVLTTRRPQQTHYLTRSMGRLIPQLKSDPKSTVFLFVAPPNAPDLDSEKPKNLAGANEQQLMRNGTAGEWDDFELLKGLVPVIQPTREMYSGFPKGVGVSKEPLNNAIKGGVDYAKAMKVCEFTNAKNIVVVEDDAEPTSHLLERLRNAIGKVDGDYAVLKLYFNEKWDGAGVDTLVHTVLSSIFWGLLFHVIYHVTVSYTWPLRKFPNLATWKGHVSAHPLANLGVFALGACQIWLGSYVIGRQHLEQVLKFRFGAWFYVTVEKFLNVSTVGQAYTKDTAVRLANEILKDYANGSEERYDIMIMEVVKNLGWTERAWRVIPNLFMHIGMISVGSDYKVKDVREFMGIWNP